ncbi:hypothetical protein [Streptacidiphilus sp. PAMC 29251]
MGEICCGTCGSERLGPLGELRTDNEARLGAMHSLTLRFRRPGVFKPRPEYQAAYGRICRDCGALTAFLDPTALSRFNAEADTVLPVEFDPYDT